MRKAPCNRACLAGKLDTFLKAVVAKDPAKAGSGVGFRQTENALLTVPGEGIWASNTGIGLDRRYYDAETGQAEFYGTDQRGREDSRSPRCGSRSRTGKVTEAEWHLARLEDPGISGASAARRPTTPPNLLANPPAARVVPVAQRVPRKQLIAAVNSYFDGIVDGTGRNIQANPGCLRLRETAWAGRTGTAARRSLPEADWQTNVDCRSGYAGLGIVNVAARRYLMVDEEAQVVVASAVFIRDPLNPKRRGFFMELFYMDGGKISSGLRGDQSIAGPLAPLPNWALYEGTSRSRRTSCRTASGSSSSSSSGSGIAELAARTATLLDREQEKGQRDPVDPGRGPEGAEPRPSWRCCPFPKQCSPTPPRPGPRSAR